MSLDIEGLFALWNDAPEDVDAATRRLAAFYHDPVLVNGVAVPLRDLATRARGVAGMLDHRETVLLDVADAGDKVAIAFRLKGRLVGSFATSLGPFHGRGQAFDVRVIDVLTLKDGLISRVWMVADELGYLVGQDAVAWSQTSSSPPPQVRE